MAMVFHPNPDDQALSQELKMLKKITCQNMLVLLLIGRKEGGKKVSALPGEL